MNKPSWDDVFMALIFVIKQRSIDTSTKHACLIVDENNALLSSGYNGPLRGSNDETIPLTRPDKYKYMEHAERNAIYNAARHGIELKGAKAIISGNPCIDCLRGLIQSGIKEIFWGPVKSNMLDSKNNEIQEIYDNMLENRDVSFQGYNKEEFVDVLISALKDAEKCGIDVKKKIDESFKK
jgi:dCMP deaminase